MESLCTGEYGWIFGYGNPVLEENDSLAIMSFFLWGDIVWNGQRGSQISKNLIERGFVAEEDFIATECFIGDYFGMTRDCVEKGYYGRDIHSPRGGKDITLGAGAAFAEHPLRIEPFFLPISHTTANIQKNFRK